MSDSRIVSIQEIDAKIRALHQQIDDNRAILELLSRRKARIENGILDDSREFLWVRSALDNRASALKETVDRLHEIRQLYRENKSTEAVRKQQMLVGMLLIDGVVKGKTATDGSIF